MRNPKDLRAFQLADSLCMRVYDSTRSFPPEERYGLQSQLRRAAVSVPTNLVEGCARMGPRDYARFVEIAYASSCEVQYLISLACRLGFIESSRRRTLQSQSKEVAKVLNGLLRSLRKQ